ncbi:MAG: hypothetical protein Q9202_004317 [Teloschistes flavicans]
MSPPQPTTPPPSPSSPPPALTSPQETLLSFPTPQILLVTLNRPSSLNCINNAQHWDLHRVWEWLDREPRLRCGIVTGGGGRAFCAGADLKEWDRSMEGGGGGGPGSGRKGRRREMPPTGFGGLSRRQRGQKPVIAAVHGVCFGGGFEMAVNADMVLASPAAVFALPEVRVGVVALAGALPRLVRTVGRQRAMELALTGRRIGAEEARQWGLVNEVVDVAGAEGGGGEMAVVRRAVEVARVICANSPDSVVASKYGVEMGWEGGGVEEGTDKVVKEMWERMEGGENMREGVRAFVEKRQARWVDSKL